MFDKQKVKKAFFWSAVDSLGSKAIGLVIGLVLASTLGPSVFGLVVILGVFTTIADVFVTGGFNSALIRKIDRNETDFSTTFYFSLSVSVICYVALYYFAPYISEFYQQPSLTLLTRVIALVIIINAFGIIQRVKLSISLDFKKQAQCTLFSVVVSGMLALGLAFSGYGVWALVIQQIILSLSKVLMLNLLVPWKPSEKFSNDAFKELFGFGSKLLLSGLIDTVYKNIYGLIIGKEFSSAQLGLFNQAEKLSSLPAMTLTNIIQKVSYPLLSSIQEDTKRLDKVYLTTLQFSAVVIFPIMCGISIISVPLINIILGSEWEMSAEYLSIISIAFAFYPIHAINLNILQVKGRSDIFLKLEIIKKISLTIMLFITVPIGIKAMCIGMVITSFLALLINTYYTGKLSSLTAITQLKAILPIAIISSISAFMGYVSGINIDSNILKIITILGVALTSYAVIMLILQRSLLITLKNTLKS